MKENTAFILDNKKNHHLIFWNDLLPLANIRKAKEMNQISRIEELLILGLKAGDYSTFSHIFSAYYQDLVIFGLRFTHDLNNAEEIIQDMFVRLWEEHESVKINNSLKSYLLKLVQNKCIDWYRHKKIMQAHTDYLMQGTPQFDYDADTYILFSELQNQIEITLANMPEEISEAFCMNRYKGLKYREIADKLNVSQRTIEVRIGKALHLLSNHLKDYFTIIMGLTIFIL